MQTYIVHRLRQSLREGDDSSAGQAITRLTGKSSAFPIASFQQKQLSITVDKALY